MKLSFLKRYAKFADLAARVTTAAQTQLACPRPSSSARSGATRARARSSTCSRSTRTSSAATRAGRTPGTRSSPTARRTSSGTCPRGSSGARSACSAPAASIDPEVFIEELDELEARGHLDRRPSRLSGNAHLIMPWHVALDQASERRLGKLQIGTTRRGIGPAYADKAARLGIRVQDLLDPKILRQKIEVALAEKNVWLERVYGAAPLELEEVAEQAARATRSGCGRTSPTRRCSSTARCATGKARALRGRAGDAARPRPRHVSVRHLVEPDRRRAPRPGSGSARRGSTRVLGVAKAYVTRVGEGPFPTEIEGPDQERLRELGGEYGTVTGRERRCGWLDLVGLRYAVRLNGITSLALTKLDVLSAFAEMPVCVRYRLPDGTETRGVPGAPERLPPREPVYETLPGWERAARRDRRRRRAARRGARATSSSSSASSASRSASSAPAPSASACSRLAASRPYSARPCRPRTRLARAG